MKAKNTNDSKRVAGFFLTLFFVAVVGLFVFALEKPKTDQASEPQNTPPSTIPQDPSQQTADEAEAHPMSIESLRKREYPGGDFVIEQTLPDGSNYRQFVVSYKSETWKIYGLLTVPLSAKPQNGYPTIIFVHGYIPPQQYSTTASYPSYQATLARAGFITFKPDLRGHGKSEGEAVSAHDSEKYVVDVMHAISYLKNYAETDSSKIGYWGHSNGGEIGLRVVVVSADIKAASFWAGVVGSHQDMLETYNEKIPFLKDRPSPLVQQYGLPSQNPEFWNKIDPFFHLDNVSAPIELQHGTADASVPIELSLRLKQELEKANKEVRYFSYAGADHNISQNSTTAWQRSIEFFRENL